MPFGTRFVALPFKLRHADLGEVESLLRAATAEDVDVWERDWQPVLVGADRADGRWPWREHVARAAAVDGWLALAVRRGAELDGLISLRLARGESQLTPGADIVYIEYLGVAPPHQLPPVGRRSIPGIGTLLVLTTVRISEEVGCDGRVGLHSKPDSEEFYRKRAFEERGYDRTDDGTWLYFEIGPDTARFQLERFGGGP